MSHSSAGENGEAALRAAVAARLGPAPEGRGYRVYLDEAALMPGDAWRPKLYRWLAECDGAVLFLTPHSLRSPWVRKEATILAWRRALRAYRGEDMPIVPVVLGDVTHDDVERAFPAVYLDESQFLPVTLTPEPDLHEIAGRIADRFPEVPTLAGDDLQTWAEEIGGWLQHLDDPFLRQVAARLTVGDDWADDGAWAAQARCLNLADSLIHAPFREVTRALSDIIRSGARTRQSLVDSLVLTCVPADAPKAVLEALCDRNERVVGVNTVDVDTVHRLVRRGLCNRRVFTVQPSSGAAGVVTENAEALYAEVAAAVIRALEFEPDTFHPDYLGDVDEPIVVMLRVRSAGGSGSDAAGLGVEDLRVVLARLRVEFGTAAVVLLGVGPDLDGDELGVGLLRRVDPPFDEQEQERIGGAIRRLRRQLDPSGREAVMA